MSALPTYPPLYLRKYQILIVGQSGTVFDSDKVNPQTQIQHDSSGNIVLQAHTSSQGAIDVSQLRCKFNIQKNYMHSDQWGDVTIYNLSSTDETEIMANAREVIVNAGYNNGPYGQIFRGSVYQPLRGKEDQTTYYCTLHCLDGDDTSNYVYNNFTLGPNQTALQIAQQIARNASVPFDQILKTKGDLSAQQTQRSKTFFGQSSQYMRKLAQNNNASFYNADGIPTLEALNTPPPTTGVPVNVETGMIGMPRQTTYGLQVRTLINPNIVVGGWIQLNNRDVIPVEIQPPTIQNLLDLDGLYRVIRIDITGDTRGNDWYYDLETVTQKGFTPNMLSGSGKSAF